MVDGTSGRRVPPRGGRGWAGTSVYSGRVHGVEHNPDLADPKRWACVAREMVRTDATIAAAWEAVIATILSARWIAEPGDETSEFSKRLGDELNQNLGLGGYQGCMKRSWESSVGQMAQYLLAGFRYGEVGWDVTPDGRIIISHAWLDRCPTSHEQWIVEPGTNDLLGVVQSLPSGDVATMNPPIIPASELVYLGRQQVGADYNGVGILRSCYLDWKAKRDLIRWEMASAEAYASPVPNVIIDYIGALQAAIAAGLDETGVRADIAAEAEAVRASAEARVRGDAGIVESTPYVRLETWGAAHDPGTFREMISAKDHAILMAFLLQLLHLGISDTGSRAVGEVHVGLWRRSLINVLDYIAAQWSIAVIPKWVEYNYGPGVDPSLQPVLKHSGLDVDPLLEVLDKLPALKGGGLLGQWGKADIDTLRRKITLDPEVEAPEEGMGDV